MITTTLHAITEKPLCSPRYLWDDCDEGTFVIRDGTNAGCEVVLSVKLQHEIDHYCIYKDKVSCNVKSMSMNYSTVYYKDVKQNFCLHRSQDTSCQEYYTFLKILMHSLINTNKISYHVRTIRLSFINF